MKDKISFDEYSSIASKLEIKLGYISEIESIPKKDKLKKFTVYFDEEEPRIVVCNVVDTFPENFPLKATTMPFVTNLQPVKIAGIESTAMIIPLQCGTDYTFILTDGDISGSELKL